jgi:hypothetical protein
LRFELSALRLLWVRDTCVSNEAEDDLALALNIFIAPAAVTSNGQDA